MKKTKNSHLQKKKKIEELLVTYKWGLRIPPIG